MNILDSRMNGTAQPRVNAKAPQTNAETPQAEEFTVEFAGVPIRIHTRFPSIRKGCEEYFTDEAPVIDVSVTAEEIEYERRLGEKTNREEGNGETNSSDRYMEWLALLRKLSERLVHHGVLLVHGCAAAVDGKAYLFTAKSGTGKTTHCRLWEEHIPGCHIMSGDKPFLLFKEGKVYVCGSPWRGKERYGTNEVLPLAGLCILERDSENHIERVSFAEAFPVLIRQSNIPKGVGAAAAMQLIAKLRNAALYRLGCNMKSDAARVSYEGMTRETNE